MDKDFDTILLTKITGSEDRKMHIRSMSELYNSMDGFKEDYSQNQNIY